MPDDYATDGQPQYQPQPQQAPSPTPAAPQAQQSWTNQPGRALVSGMSAPAQQALTPDQARETALHQAVVHKNDMLSMTPEQRNDALRNKVTELAALQGASNEAPATHNFHFTANTGKLDQHLNHDYAMLPPHVQAVVDAKQGEFDRQLTDAFSGMDTSKMTQNDLEKVVSSLPAYQTHGALIEQHAHNQIDKLITPEQRGQIQANGRTFEEFKRFYNDNNLGVGEQTAEGAWHQMQGTGVFSKEDPTPQGIAMKQAFESNPDYQKYDYKKGQIVPRDLTHGQMQKMREAEMQQSRDDVTKRMEDEHAMNFKHEAESDKHAQEIIESNPAMKGKFFVHKGDIKEIPGFSQQDHEKFIAEQAKTHQQIEAKRIELENITRQIMSASKNAFTDEEKSKVSDLQSKYESAMNDLKTLTTGAQQAVQEQTATPQAGNARPGDAPIQGVNIQSQDNIAKPASFDEAKALPPGTHFIWNGVEHVHN